MEELAPEAPAEIRVVVWPPLASDVVATTPGVGAAVPPMGTVSPQIRQTWDDYPELPAVLDRRISKS
jgi:hypothetical protein